MDEFKKMQITQRYEEEFGLKMVKEKLLEK